MPGHRRPRRPPLPLPAAAPAVLAAEGGERGAQRRPPLGQAGVAGERLLWPRLEQRLGQRPVADAGAVRYSPAGQDRGAGRGDPGKLPASSRDLPIQPHR